MEIIMFKIISDTACDYTLDYANSVDVTLVPFYVTFDEKNYYKDLYELSVEDFYQKIINNKIYPKTSLPSVQDYTDTFLPYVEKNIPVVAMTISTVLSGSYNSARIAAQQIKEDYPDAKIEVINSQLNSAAQGLLVYEAIRMNRDNVDFDTAVKILRNMTGIGSVIFTIENLDYLKKGGRIGKLATLITGALNIRPTIFLKNGELNIAGISRTRKKSINSIFENVKKHFLNNNIDPQTYHFSTGSANRYEERDELRKNIEEALNIQCIESRERFDGRVSIITGCHTGAYTTGIGFMPKYETLIHNV